MAEKDRIILVGKAWEIREKLKQYSRTYATVKEWIEATR
ncbi:Z-ring formation inhibitor MciZ [Bacillus sp. KH172YL63]|nr:Z-ring formation inhibitor MciZ [Bacillus sp. KH172YL63]